jgi:hypothetical protein
MRTYYIVINGNQSGPYPIAQLLGYGVTPETFVWTDGMGDWQMAKSIPELQHLFQPQQPNQRQPDLSKPQQQQQQPYAQQQNPYPQQQQNYNYGTPNNAFANHYVTIEKIEQKWRYYSTSYWITIATAVLGGILLAVLSEGFRFREDDMAVAIVIYGAIILTTGIIAMVNSLGIIYHCWAVIQDGGRARTKPAEAIGFLFIPIFNWYWIFVAYKGLAEDMNNYQMNRNMNYQKVEDGLPTAFCVMTLCGIIPYIGWLGSFANIVVGYLMIGGFKRSLIHVLREKQQLS